MMTDFLCLIGAVSVVSAAGVSADSRSFSVLDPCAGRACSCSFQTCVQTIEATHEPSLQKQRLLQTCKPERQTMTRDTSDVRRVTASRRKGSVSIPHSLSHAHMPRVAEVS